MATFGDYQNEIYFKGLFGVKPKLPVDFKRLEQRTHAALADAALNYVAGGCGDERTQDANIAAFERWGVRNAERLRIREVSSWNIMQAAATCY
jgi:lactate 2-monooxygenase